MKPKVLCIITTYNRIEYLQQCINSVLNQTRRPDKIYIIDNASTDKTTEILNSSGALSNQIIEYVRLETNTGGAGGFNEGIRLGLLNEYDWFWLMDDDVSPCPDALEKQLSYIDFSECIHPTKILPDNKELSWEQFLIPYLGIIINLNNRSFKLGKDWCLVNVGCFEGMLISRKIVEKIGLPDKNFFICGDDTIYGFLAHKHTNVLYIRKAEFKKLIPQSSKTTDFQLYYLVRNVFLKNKYLRNELKNRIFLYFFMILFFIKNLVSTLLLDLSPKRTGVVLKAIWDGANNRFGKTF